jgi:hypothetical protein
MSQASPQMRDLAARLIAFETKGNKSPMSDLPAAVQVCEKLRPHLAMLMGKGGFHAVLSRALAVASAEVEWLVALRVHVDGPLEGWDKAGAQVDAKERMEAGVILVAQLLALLVAFIGDDLTLRFVRDVWPKASLDDLNSTKGVTHEKV